MRMKMLVLMMSRLSSATLRLAKPSSHVCYSFVCMACQEYESYLIICLSHLWVRGDAGNVCQSTERGQRLWTIYDECI